MGNTSFWKETGVRFAGGGEDSFLGGGSEFFGGEGFLGGCGGVGGGTLLATSFLGGGTDDSPVLLGVPEEVPLSLPLDGVGGGVGVEPVLGVGSLFSVLSVLPDVAGAFSTAFAFDSALAWTMMGAR